MEKYTLSEIKDEKELIIYHHLGIGDHIVCNGLVNFISENHRIHLPVKKKYSQMVQHLYSKNNKVRKTKDELKKMVKSTLRKKSVKDTVQFVASKSNISKKIIYQLCLEINEKKNN